MKRLILISITMLFIAGCESFRFAPTEIQKQNALLHNRTAVLAAQRAKTENSSDTLCGLTQLSAEQSEAFILDTGHPQNTPAIFTEEQILQSGGAIAQAAAEDSVQRPDIWTMADSAMDLGIALAGLVGGVYGLKTAQYIRTAKDKSKALKEIITNNELFKKMYPKTAARFKSAQTAQSPATKQIVAEIKTGG